MSITKIERVGVGPMAEQEAKAAKIGEETQAADAKEMLGKLKNDELMLNWIRDKGIRNVDVERIKAELVEMIKTLEDFCNV